MKTFAKIDIEKMIAIISFSFENETEKKEYYFTIQSPDIAAWKLYANKKGNFKKFQSYMDNAFGSNPEKVVYWSGIGFYNQLSTETELAQRSNFTQRENYLHEFYSKNIDPKNWLKVTKKWHDFFYDLDFNITPVKEGVCQNSSSNLNVRDYLVYLKNTDLKTIEKMNSNLLTQSEMAKMLFKFHGKELSFSQIQIHVDTLLEMGLILEDINLANRGVNRYKYQWFYDLLGCALITTNSQTDEYYPCSTVGPSTANYLRLAGYIATKISLTYQELDDKGYYPPLGYSDKLGGYAKPNVNEKWLLTSLLFNHEFLEKDYGFGNKIPAYIECIKNIFLSLELPKEQLKLTLPHLLGSFHITGNSYYSGFYDEQAANLLSYVFKEPLKMDSLTDNMLTQEILINMKNEWPLTLKEVKRIYS